MDYAARTRPRRCSRPLPSFARFILARIVSFLWNVLFLMATSMRTMSCHTIRPAPRFRCLVRLLNPSPHQRPHVYAPDFRIAHKSVRKPYSRSVCCEAPLAMLGADLVHVCCRPSLDCVPLESWFGRDAPAIVHAGKVSGCKRSRSWGRT
jgi:hypothetical protein